MCINAEGRSEKGPVSSREPRNRTRDTGHKMKYETAYLNRGEKNNNYKKPPTKKTNKLFYCEGGQTLDQVVQRRRGVSVLGDSQNLAGHSPRPPPIVHPA